VNSCPACDSAAVEATVAISFGDLRRLWFERAEIDIATCLDTPFDGRDVVLTRCRDCGLEFFPRALCGSGALYDHLGRFPYYYQSDRWEFAAALDALPVAPARVLEVGCGLGRFLEALRQRYPEAEVRGIDLSPNAVAHARSRGLNVERITLDRLAADQPDTFDAVYAFQVLEHVPSPGDFLRQAIRVLRPGGHLVIGVPNAAGFTAAAVNDFGNLPPHHLTRWSPAVFEKVAARQGMVVTLVREEPVAPYHREWYRTVSILRAMSRLFGRRWRPIELGTGFRLAQSIAARLQRAIPSAFWRYSRPGHTMLVALRKRA
jgi:SAM-dependent methyltransferase